jgi:hypothetical protein
MTMPVSHVTVRVLLTIRRRPGRKTLVSLGLGAERAGASRPRRTRRCLEGLPVGGLISGNILFPARRHASPNGMSESRRNVQSYRFGSQRLAMRQATVKAGLKTLPTS